MKITLVTDKPVVAANNTQRPRKPLIGSRLNQNTRPRTNGTNRPRQGGRPTNNKRQTAPSKEQLDAELDAYVNKVTLIFSVLFRF